MTINCPIYFLYSEWALWENVDDNLCRLKKRKKKKKILENTRKRFDEKEKKKN